MSLKKMLGIITVVIVSVFALMLTTSYAWYSYENASTKFDVVTATDNVEIVFQAGDYINTQDAIPVAINDVDLYSDKYDFNIKVKNVVIGNEMVAKISLVDIVIDDELKKIDEELGDSPFKVELYYQGAKVGNTITGKDFSSDTYEVGDVVLSNSIDNQFELRVYLLDNGSDQANLMNKRFQAKIDVNVISRVSASIKNFDDPDISISEITIDGEISKHLPVSGYYDMKAVCQKGSSLTWDAYSKTIHYGNGSMISDSCTLDFVSSKGKKYLKDVSVGSYIQYSGNNGCDGDSCLGENANYHDDNQMGYCYDSHYQYVASGYRVLNVSDDTAYIVSAGALECSKQENADKVASKYCNPKYAYGGVCDINSVWSIRESDITNINQIYGNDLIDNGGYYWYTHQNNEIGIWNASNRKFDTKNNYVLGVRPVIRMNSDVLVVSGSGSYEDPYVIGK